MADAWAAVDAGTATEEQLALVKAQAKGLADGPKALRDRAVSAAIAAGKRMMRCNGAACTDIGPEGSQHRYRVDGRQRSCGRYRLHL